VHNPLLVRNPNRTQQIEHDLRRHSLTQVPLTDNLLQHIPASAPLGNHVNRLIILEDLVHLDYVGMYEVSEFRELVLQRQDFIRVQVFLRNRLNSSDDTGTQVSGLLNLLPGVFYNDV
jgi:hypothetical protein